MVVTGATLHSDRIHELCAEFTKRGRQIALGGTYASIEHDKCKELATYQQEQHIDMKSSPAPDWSLIHVGDYVNINIQTSRG